MSPIAFAIIFAAALHYQGVLANRFLVAGRPVSPLADHITAFIVAVTITAAMWAFSHFILGNGGAL